MADVAETKTSLRKQMARRVQQKLSYTHKSQADAQIRQHLSELLKEVRGPVAGFRNLPDEPDLWELSQEQVGRWAFPKVDGVHLRFYRMLSDGPFKIGAFDVLEPQNDGFEEIALQNCEATVVPAVAFDRQGRRLGRGKGFYDRALANYGGRKIGVCYSFQMVNRELPPVEHDCLMDVVVTEKFLLWPMLRN